MPRSTYRSQDSISPADPVCPVCGRRFLPDNERAVYCSTVCRKRAQNARHYKAHADKINDTNNERQKAQRKRLFELENE